MILSFIKPGDLSLIQAKGLNRGNIETQLKLFHQGAPFASLTQACTLEHGIKKLSQKEIASLVSKFEEFSRNLKLIKFVPASGAATRMFKNLWVYYKNQTSQNSLKESLEPKLQKEIQNFIDEIHNFPFTPALSVSLKREGYDLISLKESKNYLPILKHLLTIKGLNLPAQAKALLAFHRYKKETRTAFQEHIVEAQNYALGQNGMARLHLTVAAEHQNQLQEYFDKIRPHYENQGPSIEVNFSVQEPNTQTLAVDLDNRPIRTETGKLLFRPGGHGALLQNLNQLNGDLVFIKNIDNVAIDAHKPITYLYKKALGGLLLNLQKQIYTYLEKLETNSVDELKLREIADFAKQELGTYFPENFFKQNLSEQQQFLFSKLNRPLRICGMVENCSEPGGGPFWVKDKDGGMSCQIVESAQVNFLDEEQKKIFTSSTHFNPVDLVCGIRDFKGRPFDLTRYKDPSQVFISEKTEAGRKLKALEYPGLWNGGMAHWNTVFVEVPLETFTPVKTINDLLKKEHQ